MINRATSTPANSGQPEKRSALSIKHVLRELQAE
jgi:hypothetical protein